jgi:hypothetical protein
LLFLYRLVSNILLFWTKGWSSSLKTVQGIRF